MERKIRHRFSWRTKAKNVEAPDVKELTPTFFGYIIAFLLPGLLGRYALTYWSSPVRTMLAPVLKADANVGPSIILNVDRTLGWLETRYEI